MTRSISSLAFALALFGAGGAASAAELSYTYIEAGRIDVDADGGGDADGWIANGAFAITPHVHVYGGYGSTKIDGSTIDVDISRLGVGWNTGINDNNDLYVRANYLDVDAGFPFGESDGYEAEVGMRTAFGTHFETQVAAGYADIDRGSGDFYGKLGAQYKFGPRWGINATATLSDEANEFFVGPRISF